MSCTTTEATVIVGLLALLLTVIPALLFYVHAKLSHQQKATKRGRKNAHRPF